MSLDDRRRIYAEIEKSRGRHLIAVYLSSRPGLSAIMAPDMLPSLFRQVSALPGDANGVDILIESFGGLADVAIRLNDVLREAKRDVEVLVPRSAFSAATMLALGATKIWMHPFSCLGPIDPQLHVRKPDGSVERVGAEDIKAFVEFVKDEVGISDQREIATVFQKLLDHVPPIQLGVARRASMRAVQIAKELLQRHIKKGDAQTQVNLIADRLAGGYHEHGHPISPTDAAAMGLPVEVAALDFATAMWRLVEDADVDMNTESPYEPFVACFDEWQKRRSAWEAALEIAAQNVATDVAEKLSQADRAASAAAARAQTVALSAQAGQAQADAAALMAQNVPSEVAAQIAASALAHAQAARAAAEAAQSFANQAAQIVQAVQAAQAQPRPTKLDFEIGALKHSLDTPVTYQADALLGLVESVRAASRCEARYLYVGTVTQKGTQVFGGPPKVIWKTIP